MRLSCEAQVSNRTFPGAGLKKGKNSHSSLSIGFPPGAHKQADNLHVLLSTAQNKTGTKYKVKTNVLKVLDKFVNDGMLTIRFKEPAHDVLISKADPLQLKSFLKVLRLCLSGTACDKLCFPRLASASSSQVQAPKTKVEVGSRRAYLELSTLPATLTILRLNNCELKKISERVSKLRRLRCLNLSDNEIAEIPAELGRADLDEVHLANNRICAVSPGLFAANWARTLTALDLSRNGLAAVPGEICNLEQLVTLRLSHNRLTGLPDNLWRLRRLKHFSASDNLLPHLPGTLALMRFEHVDVSANPFRACEAVNAVTLGDDGVPALREWASRSVLKARLVYGPEDLPATLVRDLATFCKCVCGTVFVLPSVRVFSTIRLSSISNTVSYSTGHGENLVPVRTNLCSHACVGIVRRAHCAS